MQVREPEPVNILTALAENERIVKNETDPERKAIALARSSILWAIYTSLYTRLNYSLLTIPTVIEVAMKSASG
jgi:hypothetical protein